MIKSKALMPAFSLLDMMNAYNRGVTAILDGNGHGESFEEYMKRVHEVEFEPLPVVYIDKPIFFKGKVGKRKKGDKAYSHMICSDLKYLHDFAKRLGLGRGWFENKRGRNQPHYDVPQEFFNSAKELGAEVITSKELLAKLKEFSAIK